MSYSINKKINWLEQNKFASGVHPDDENENDFFTIGVDRDDEDDEENDDLDLLSEKELQKLENEQLFDDDEYEQ
jgi:hypothetical protein